MTPEELKNILAQKIDYIAHQCDVLTSSFDREACHNFKIELKTIRSFMEMVRLNSSDSVDFHLSIQAKKLYYITSLFMDANNELARLLAADELSTSKSKELNGYMSKAATEWGKAYTKTIITRLEKQLLDHNYSKVPGAILDNFFSRHITGRYTMTSKVEFSR